MLYATNASTDRKSNINMENKDIVNAKDYLDNLIGDCQNNLSKDIDHDNNTKNVNLTSLGTETQDFKPLNIENTSCSKKQIACAYKRNELMQAIMKTKVDGLQKLPGEILKKVKLSMEDFRVDKDKLYIKKKLYIPNNDELRICVLWQHLDPPEQGHLNHKTMFQSMQNRYF